METAAAALMCDKPGFSPREDDETAVIQSVADTIR